MIFLFQDLNKKFLNQLNSSQKVWLVKTCSSLTSVIMQLIHMVHKLCFTFWNKPKVLKSFWFTIVGWEHLELRKLLRVLKAHQIWKPSLSEETECKMPVFKLSHKAFNMFHYWNNFSFTKTLFESKVFTPYSFSYLNIART